MGDSPPWRESGQILVHIAGFTRISPSQFPTPIVIIMDDHTECLHYDLPAILEDLLAEMVYRKVADKHGVTFSSCLF
jgi:hypothetical protein